MIDYTLQELYKSEINVKIGWFWDGGIEVHIGNGIYDVYDQETETKTNHDAWLAATNVKTIEEANDWLKKKAIELYPDSDFAKKAVLLEGTYEEFRFIVKPLIKYLAENHHPHTKIIIDSTTAEMVEGVTAFKTEEFLVD